MINAAKIFAFFTAIAAAFLLLSSSGWSQESGRLTATVDRKQVSAGETLTLEVRYHGQADAGAPDFSLLEENFIIKSRRETDKITSFNGVVEAYKQWTLIIEPRRQGKLLVPSFRYKNSFSDAIQVNVTEPGEVPQDLDEMLLQTEVSKSTAYVQEQIVVTYRLLTSRSIQSMDAEALSIDGVRVEALPQTQYHRDIKGVSYAVLEVSYALFPQTSEPFTIPSQRWLLRVLETDGRSLFRFGGGRYELRRLDTDEKRIEVLPKPDTYPTDATWLPAQEVELSQEWSESPAKLQVGEPITRTLHLRARGLTAAQLPPIPFSEPPAQAKFYPGQAEQKNEPDARGMTGIRTEELVVVPSQPGEITLPPIEVTWWNTQTDRVEIARLPEQTLFVADTGAAAGSTAQDRAAEPVLPDTEPAPGATVAPPSAEKPRSLLWQAATLVCALLALAFAFLWWRARQQINLGDSATGSGGGAAVSTTDEKRAFRALQTVAEKGSAAELRMSLLAWAARRWPQQPPQSLTAIGSLTGDADIAQQLKALDAALYGSGTSDFAPQRLLQSLKTWRRQPAASSREDRLRPLY